MDQGSARMQATAPDLIAPRRQSRAVAVAGVMVGGEAPIVVQSMTNTDTADVAGTVKQVAALARAGSELVRITVDRDEAAKAVPHIRDGLAALGLHVPLIGDFHYNGHKLLTEYPAAPRRSTSTASIPATSASRPSATGSSRRSSISPALRQAGAHRRQLGLASIRSCSPA